MLISEIDWGKCHVTNNGRGYIYYHKTINGRTYRKYQHHYVWEQNNGIIRAGCVIHHKNFLPYDNRIENLECMTTKSHCLLHAKIAHGWMIIDGEWWNRCDTCKELYKPQRDFCDKRKNRYFKHNCKDELLV